jgi:REP element-mobilizing transposase RayT
MKLTEPMRQVVDAAVREICQVRSWTLWSVSSRSNHVHVVVTAPNYKPKLVRDQLKAKATRDLRQSFHVWKGRPVWSANGDIEYLDSELEVEQCVAYVQEAQDRMGRDNP